MEVDKKVEGAISNVSENTGKVAEKISDTAGNIKDSATEAASKATNAAKTMIEPYMNSSGAIYGLLLVIIVASLTAYGLYVLVTGVIFQQSRDVIEGTRIPILCNIRTRIPITTFHNSGNGQRRSYSFWIYINDMNKFNGLYKHVLHIGDETNISSASPFVFLDKTENKLHVRFSATYDDSFKTPMVSVENMSSSDFSMFMKQGVTIPYIPIQRWVHIAVVINENSNGGTITTYVDGDMSAIVSSGELTETGTTVKVANLNIDKKGDLYTGGLANGVEGCGFSGLISRVVIYNYDLNQKDVYKEYNDGPIDGILAKLGLGAYGVRSPIYKIS